MAKPFSDKEKEKIREANERYPNNRSQRARWLVKNCSEWASRYSSFSSAQSSLSQFERGQYGGKPLSPKGREEPEPSSGFTPLKWLDDAFRAQEEQHRALLELMEGEQKKWDRTREKLREKIQELTAELEAERKKINRMDEKLLRNLEAARVQRDQWERRCKEAEAELKAVSEDSLAAKAIRKIKDRWLPIPKSLVPDNEIREELRKGQFCFVRKAKHGHMFRNPGNQTIVVPGTPSDHRSRQNTLADIRRAANSAG